ncbi:N-acyl-D-amino-acid deacylase family protein [Microlunatus ginsengisoli]|uniref:D-aminoacylase n=1 Tax=Microlunatus ginsengisoli TaxID=363863 RepID=A0ABP6ZL18_9ACTN
MTDLLIRDALVVDGTGAPGFPADVVVDGGRIREVTAAGRGPSARRILAADRRVLAPGFIDMHAHSDLQILADPAHTAKVSQGVTCELLGQDGLSFAPVDGPTRELIGRQVAGWNGEPAGLELGWDSVGGYLDRLDRGIACHAAYLVPQGTVRMLIVGTDDRPATEPERARMVALVRQGLAEGAVGMSSGLTYPPGMFADDDELVELCRVVAESGGFYAPHHRSYGVGALAAYAEMIEVCRRAGCALHLTHATMNFEPNRGRAGELLAMIDDALDGGADITLDSYPYLPGSTTLAALLPSWAAAGGPDALLARLGDAAARARIADALDRVGSDGCHGCVVDWSTIQISGVARPELSAAVGRSVAELAAEQGRSPAEVCFDLLVRDGLATTILQHVGDEDNVRAIMRHRVHTGGSDAILVGQRPHPRGWGTFPRYLGRYVRELAVLGLEDCVHHLTGRAAARLRLVDRGLVRVGQHADLVLFDPATVQDTATFEDPRRQAVGIDMCW